MENAVDRTSRLGSEEGCSEINVFNEFKMHEFSLQHVGTRRCNRKNIHQSKYNFKDIFNKLERSDFGEYKKNSFLFRF